MITIVNHSWLRRLSALLRGRWHYARIDGYAVIWVDWRDVLYVVHVWRSQNSV